MNTAKTTKREPNKKELRKDLADKKAKYEELGWAFDHDTGKGWEARKGAQKIGHYEKLENLLGEIDGLIEEKYAPKVITDEDRIPDNTEVVFEQDGKKIEGSVIGEVKDEKTSAEGENPLTLEQAAKVSDWMAARWKIAKSGNIWKAEKDIEGKKVEAQNENLDSLFAQLAEIEPAKEEKPLKPSETLPESEIKKCRFELTDEDIKHKTNALTETFGLLKLKRTSLADIKKQYKKDIENLEKEQGELVDQIDSRIEFRPLECNIEYDLARGEKVYYRPDTQEQVDRCSMTKDELKIALAAAEKAKQPDLF